MKEEKGRERDHEETELINDNVVHCMWLLINKDVYP